MTSKDVQQILSRLIGTLRIARTYSMSLRLKIVGTTSRNLIMLIKRYNYMHTTALTFAPWSWVTNALSYPIKIKSTDGMSL